MALVAFYTRAYNAEKCLSRAIESILNQTERDLVYYISDNGSTDRTREIIKNYAAVDSRIRPIYRDANSPVDCFNEALNIIYQQKDGYLAILDADDWYDKCFAEVCLGKIQENSDLAICGSYFETSGNAKRGILRQWTYPDGSLSEKQIGDYFPLLYPFFRTSWGKLFRLEILRDNHILHRENVLYGGDTLFVFDFLNKCGNIAVTNEILHHYLMSNYSGSHHYYDGRIADDARIYLAAKSYLDKMEATTKLNCIFMQGVNVNAFIDTFRELMESIKIGQTRETPADVLQSDFVQSCWNYFSGLSEQVKIKYNIDGQYDQWRKLILISAIQAYPAGKNYMYYDILKFICPEIEDFWDTQDVDCFMKPGIIQTEFLARKWKSAWAQANGFNGNDDGFYHSLKTYLAIRLNLNFEYAAEYFTENSYRGTARQKSFIILHHPVLCKIPDSQNLLEYPVLLKHLFKKEYIALLQLLPDIISELIDLKSTKAESFISFGLYMASLAENSEYFIFFTKADLELQLTKGNLEKFRSQYRDLINILPNDQDLNLLYHEYLRIQGESI